MLSIILLSYQSEKRIEKFFDGLKKRMLKENIEFESTQLWNWNILIVFASFGVVLGLFSLAYYPFGVSVYRFWNQLIGLIDLLIVWICLPFFYYMVFTPYAFFIRILGKSKFTLKKHKMNELGVNAVFHYQPLHSSPAGEKYGKYSSPLPFTDDISERIVRLPLWIGFNQNEKVKNALISALDKT